MKQLMDVSVETRCRMTEMKRLLYGTQHISDDVLLADLFDLYEFCHLSAYQHWIDLLKVKLQKGVSRKDLFYLKMIYTFLGHFLQRLKEL